MKLPSLKKIKWKKKLWLFAVIGGLGLAFYLFASSKSEVVETALCKAGRMEEYISLQGKAELDDLSYIYARTSGIVTELLLEEGEKVESGQIAAKLDGEDVSFAVGKLSAALGQAQAALQASRQQAEQAASYGEKMEQLYLAGGISKQAYEEALTAREVAQANLAQAENAARQANVALQEAESQKGRTQVASLVSGTIMEKLVLAGTAVAPGTPLYAVGNTATAYLTADVLSEDAYKLKLGQKVRITGDALGGKDYSGAVSFIAPQAETHLSSLGVEQQRVEVRVQPSELIPVLKKGYAVELEIVIKAKDDALYVPEAALFAVGDRDAVFVLAKGKVQLRQVVTGLENDDYVELAKGVAAGESVVLDPPDNLTDGMKARVE